MGSRQSIGGIRPFAELTRGPMTVVYKGYDPSADTFVLLKVLRPDYSRDRAIREAFSNEARMLARVQHPNVVAVVDSGVDGDTGFLVTEFIEGLSLREMLDRDAIPPSLAAYVAAQTASGLEAAHGAGVLHRDLKPDNILISVGGEVKITDFGMAVTSESAGKQKPLIAGTLGFVAPEVIKGEAPSEASDVFSLGATLYHMLTGVAAFAGSSDGEIIDATLNRNPMHRVNEFSTAPPGLLVICGRLLQKRPEDRLTSSAEAASVLHDWLEKHDGSVGATNLARYVTDPTAIATTPESVTLARDRSGSEGALFEDGSLTPATSHVTAVHDTRGATSRWRGWKPVSVAAAAAVFLLLAASIFLLTDPNATRDSTAVEGSGVTATSPPALLADSTDSGITLLGQTRPTLPDSAGVLDDQNVTPDAIRTASIEDRRNERQPPESMASTDGPTEEISIRDDTNGGGELSSTPLEPNPEDKAALEPALGTISVNTVPWASLWVDGNSLGQDFPDTLTLEAGNHTLVLQNPDFPEVVQEIDVFPGEHRDYDVSLWARVARLSLVVVPWAVVEIDGTVRDTIPPQERPFILSPGAHRLRLVHPELGEITRDVLLTAGEHRNLSYNMRRASAE